MWHQVTYFVIQVYTDTALLLASCALRLTSTSCLEEGDVSSRRKVAQHAPYAPPCLAPFRGRAWKQLFAVPTAVAV
jgi:hypothetical protein